MLALLGAVTAAVVLTWPAQPPEVVTVPGDGTNAGVTSSLALGSLDVEHWRLPLPPSEGGRGLWVHDLEEESLVVGHGWGPPVRVDRDTGALSTVSGPTAPDRPILLLEAGHVVRLDPGAPPRLVGEAPGGEATSELARELERVGELWIGATSTEVIALDDDLEVVWRHTHGDDWLERTEDVGDRVLLVWQDASSSRLTLRIEAVDRATGRPAWDRDDLYSALPAGDRYLVTQTDGTVAALDVTTGEAIWTLDGLAGDAFPAGYAEWRAGDETNALLSIGDGVTELVSVRVADGAVISRSDPGAYGWYLWLADRTVGALVRLPGPEGGTALVRPDGTEAWVTNVSVESDPDVQRDVRVDPATGRVVVVSADAREGRVRVEALPDGEVLVDVTVGPGQAAETTQPIAVAGGVLAIDPWEGPTAGLTGGWLIDIATGERIGELPRSSRVHAVAGGFVAGYDQSGPRRDEQTLSMFEPDGTPRWVLDEPGEFDESWLAAATDRLLVVSRVRPDRALLEVRSQTDGAFLGEIPAADGYVEIAGIADEAVLLAGWSSGGAPDAGPWLAAFDLDGSEPVERWRRSRMGHPLVDGDRLVEVGRALFRTIDTADGTAGTPMPLAVDGWLRPAVAGGLLVVAPERELVVHDVMTGELAWTRELPAPATSAPAIAGDEVLLGLRDGTVRRFALRDGAERGAVTIGSTPVLEVVAVHGVLLARDHESLVMRGPAELPRRLRSSADAGSTLTPGGPVQLPAP